LNSVYAFIYWFFTTAIALWHCFISKMG